MAIGKALRLWRTVRYLRPVQVLGRLALHLPRGGVDPRPAPSVRGACRPWSAMRELPATQTGADRFCFLGVERALASAQDWNRADWPLLWSYNLHYFDDLVAEGAPERRDWHRALVARWMAENPPGTGIGWAPYPSSLRIANWIQWSLAGNALDEASTHSLAMQARFLRRRLEHHLLGNHLWANAKALVFAGAYFGGPEAEAWLNTGLRLLRRELAEQVLSDGGHFERSPMYHAIILTDILDLIQLDRCYPALLRADDVEAWRGCAGRMLRWLQVMSHPDGGIAFFNDAAFDIAPPLATLRRYAQALALPVDGAPLAPVETLGPSGYMRLQSGGAVLIADVGVVGPDYLPGHAHADTLSFELSVDGHRVLVNSGTSTYENSAERLRQRGTAAHNTVVVDGQDSSEVWSSFRVARRARPFDVASGEEGGTAWLKAAHDGYRRLAGKVVHRREWRLSSLGLSVTDRLEGDYASAEARFHFAPGSAPGWRAEGATASLSPSTWHPRFGGSDANLVLSVQPSGPVWTTHFHWTAC